MEEKEVKKDDVIEPTTVEEVDPIAERDEEIARLTEERDNYKNVALKRLGKLPADSSFLGDEGKEIDSIIEEKVKAALLDKEIDKIQAEKDAKIKQLVKENNELRLSHKNRPDSGIGGDNGTGPVEVKDNVFSTEQLAKLKERAILLKADPDKFIEKAKQNFLSHR